MNLVLNHWIKSFAFIRCINDVSIMCNGFNNVIIMLCALCVRVYASASYIRTTVERRDETGSRFESKNVSAQYSSRSGRKLTRIGDIIDLGRHNVCG